MAQGKSKKNEGQFAMNNPSLLSWRNKIYSAAVVASAVSSTT